MSVDQTRLGILLAHFAVLNLAMDAPDNDYVPRAMVDTLRGIEESLVRLSDGGAAFVDGRTLENVRTRIASLEAQQLEDAQ